MSLIEQLVGAVRRAGTSVAVVEGAGRHTYAELDSLSSAMAGGLAGLGVHTGDVVAVNSTRSWERCAAVLAAWRLGAGVVSVDPGLPEARIRKIITGAGAQLVVHADGVASTGTVRECSFVSLRGTPITEVSDGPISYVIPTSGSTGEPKSVAVGPEVLEDLGNWHIAHWQHDVLPHTLHAASIGFDVVYEDMVATWLAGSTLVIVDDATRRDFFALIPLIREHEVARFFLPVASLHGLAMVGVFGDERLPSLRELNVAGERLVINDEVRKFCAVNDIALINQYGPSETHVVTQLRLGRDPLAWPDFPSIGTAVVDAALHREQDGVLRPFTVGDEAELVISGRCVGLGYLGDDELTAARFQSLPDTDGVLRRCYRSGDLVRFDGGEYHFVSRVDDQLKIRGYRVEPGEVEAIVGAVPGVRRAVALGVRKKDGVRLAVCYCLERDATTSVADLRNACQAVLPDYMVPQVYVEVEEFPITPNGKVDRQALAGSVS